MTTLFQDIRYGIRTLIQHPGFTLISVLAIGLAIGATSAMFSVVNAVLLKPLSFDSPQNVAIVWESNPSGGFPWLGILCAGHAPGGTLDSSSDGG